MSDHSPHCNDLPQATPKKEVELPNGEAPPIRLTIDARATSLEVADGFSVTVFVDSGVRTTDGAQVWTPKS